jgi:TRAP-type C4-dicarboxylate transport system substrate-binding protein
MTAMLATFLRGATIASILLPLAAFGEPIKLKLAFFTSDQTRTYTIAIKPFVDAVNADEAGGILIEPYPGGALGKDLSQQAQLVRDGSADIAFVVLGTVPNQFKDHAVMELPGLFRDMREATFVNTWLLASGLMQGYEEFFVIGSFASEAQTIHTRVPIASLEDLRGKRIRSNNPIEASTLALLGMSPIVLPIGKTQEAISRGTIDGTATAAGPLIDFGLGRVVTYHYLLRLGPSVRSILMNRAKFESLPKAGQDVIRKYSGAWLAERVVDGYEPSTATQLEQLKSDPARTVISPMQSEIDEAEAAFRAVRNQWADASPHHRLLLNAVEAEIAKFRSGQ